LFTGINAPVAAPVDHAIVVASIGMDQISIVTLFTGFLNAIATLTS